jgi:hypothetical protein
MHSINYLILRTVDNSKWSEKVELISPKPPELGKKSWVSLHDALEDIEKAGWDLITTVFNNNYCEGFIFKKRKP